MLYSIVNKRPYSDGLAENQKALLLEDRNNHCLETLAEMLTMQDCVTFWGVAHAPGILDGLKQMGFHLTHSAWLSAINFNKVSAALES